MTPGCPQGVRLVTNQFVIISHNITFLLLPCIFFMDAMYGTKGGKKVHLVILPTYYKSSELI